MMNIAIFNGKTRYKSQFSIYSYVKLPELVVARHTSHKYQQNPIYGMYHQTEISSDNKF